MWLILEVLYFVDLLKSSESEPQCFYGQPRLKPQLYPMACLKHYFKYLKRRYLKIFIGIFIEKGQNHPQTASVGYDGVIKIAENFKNDRKNKVTWLQRVILLPSASVSFPFFHPGRHLHVHFRFEPVVLFFSLHSSLSKSEKIDLLVPSGIILWQ